MTETFEQFASIFAKIFEINGLFAYSGSDTARKFYDFARLLSDVGEKTNLTAINTTADTVLKHFADSLIAAGMFAHGASVIDIGCGAGFPSIPLAIVRPDLRIVSLDSTGKKVDFVKEAANKLELENVSPVCARAEEFSADHREKFDFATARAVSRLNILCELSLPLVKIGGSLIAMKARDGQAEQAEAKKGIAELGGKIKEASTLTLTSPGGEEFYRYIINVEKISNTPAKYPRPYAKIIKKPL